MASTPTIDSLLHGASSEDIATLRDLLSDEVILRFGKYMNSDGLWNSDAFVDKIGFDRHDVAIRNARTKGLIACEMSLSDAVGLTAIEGRPIINPIPAGTAVPPKSRARARFMGTQQVLEWISGANTESAASVRKALWWFFFLSDKERMQGKLDEAERKV